MECTPLYTVYYLHALQFACVALACQRNLPKLQFSLLAIMRICPSKLTCQCATAQHSLTTKLSQTVLAALDILPDAVTVLCSSPRLPRGTLPCRSFPGHQKMAQAVQPVSPWTWLYSLSPTRELQSP